MEVWDFRCYFDLDMIFELFVFLDVGFDENGVEVMDFIGQKFKCFLMFNQLDVDSFDIWGFLGLIR